MKKNAFDPVRARIWALTGLMGLCLLAFAGVMYYTQILHGEENRAKSLASNAASETVEASRGIITDRNGKVLVSNRLTYTLIFSAKDFENDQDLNAAILRLTDLCTENNTVWNDTLPLSKTAPYSYTDAQDSEGFALFLKNKSIPYSKLSQVTPTLQPDRFMAKLRELFKIDSSYTDDQARTIAGVRYELAVKSLTDAQYVFADDVSVELISQTADGQYQGVSTGTSSARVYNTEYAAHVLGRLSPIYYEDWVGDPENGVTGYRDMEGYSMNSLVGREGAEKAFESYLHGTKGTRIITTNEEGKITGELYTKEPQPGGTVALTLDIDVQEDTEKSLAQTIEAMTAKDGIVRGGAAVVVGVGSGEVLAMASYPTYNLSTFDQDYSKLVSDTVGTPLLNRAIGGAYAPGSTFKPCTAVAALESGIITPSSTIVDRGVYDYYKSPQPRCWIYSSYGSTHGRVNVSEAITVSCNYFFYELGSRMTIEMLNETANGLGLGVPTGIELTEKVGWVTDEASKKAAYGETGVNSQITAGDRVLAAIGQAENRFSPLQLCVYASTLANKGTRMKATFLSRVVASDYSSLIKENSPEIMSQMEIASTTYNTYIEGMRLVIAGGEGTARSHFGGPKDLDTFPVAVCGKTGTAQHSSGGSDHGAFICFAPMEDPEIAVAVYGEKAAHGATLAAVAEDILRAYFAMEAASEVNAFENQAS